MHNKTVVVPSVMEYQGYWLGICWRIWRRCGCEVNLVVTELRVEEYYSFSSDDAKLTLVAFLNVEYFKCIVSLLELLSI